MAPKKELGTAEEVELEYRRLQVEEMREASAARLDRRERLAGERARRAEDHIKNSRILVNKQRICLHRKGGRNNQFAKGTDANYSVITNTYPDGRICISCSRCGKEVWKPTLALKKTDRELYSTMFAEWQVWANFPTDNSPSGGKVFEILQDVA